ncbi:hypothetical protein [Clostridium sp. UBA6640]|uniref:hypothetical protein n=1 Tax=Clostridium sp. UBA6640 TaxID=1946370 RepID=UPI0025B852FE|nr:hypothetical protein [Clostridium sp. UBA6640]
MTEQELLTMFIQQRVNMLLATLNKTKSKKSVQDHEIILQAELFIDNLPGKGMVLEQNYIQ